MGRTFKILSVDGGGIRGIFPAHILACLQERLNIEVINHFDLVAGTSTGAIVAASQACQIHPSKVRDLYVKHGRSIFSRKNPWLPRKWEAIFRSRYGKDPLQSILSDIFGELTLGDICIPLLLPSTDIGNGRVHVFKSRYSDEFTRDIKVPIKDAILASCSAPTYFDPSKVGEYLLADGGLWANNPALAAIIEAQKYLGIDIRKIKVLSLGTGSSKLYYGTKRKRKWGLLGGWQGKDFIDFLMSLQSQSIQNYIGLMLKKDQLLRIDFESDNPLPLDKCSAVYDLISRADMLFTHNIERLKHFFETGE